MRVSTVRGLFVGPATVAVFLMLVMAGCGSNNIYRVSPIISYERQYTSIHTFESSTLKADYETINPDYYRPQSATEPLATTARTAFDVDVAKRARNELVHTLISVSDRNVAAHLSRATGTQIEMNMITGTAALALSGTASLMTGSTAQILAAGAAGATGFRALFSEQVYRDALIQTLVGAIQSKRAEFYTTVILENQKKPVSEYCVAQAIADAQRYHDLGSFYMGLTFIRESAERENQNRMEGLQLKRRLDAGIATTAEEQDALSRAQVRNQRLQLDAKNQAEE